MKMIYPLYLTVFIVQMLRNMTGSGLGLAIAKKVIEDHLVK